MRLPLLSLAAAAALALAGPALADPAAPANVWPPAVAGSPRVGDVVAASSGSWSGAPLSYAFQWLRGGTPIAGATGAVYTPAAADAGAYLAVRVTATGAGGSASAESSPYGPIAPAQVLVVPGVDTPADPSGANAGADPGVVPPGGSDRPTSVAPDPVAPAEPLASPPALPPTQAAPSPQAVAAARVAAPGAPAPSPRAATARPLPAAVVVRATRPASAAALVVRGSARVGATLRAQASGARVAYRWQIRRGGRWLVLPGATHATLLVRPAFAGFPLRVVVGRVASPATRPVARR